MYEKGFSTPAGVQTLDAALSLLVRTGRCKQARNGSKRRKEEESTGGKAARKEEKQEEGRTSIND